jgi:(4S)-4-hydroxy-5-phosphonooxypentane-2,3-dione isomerase
MIVTCVHVEVKPEYIQDFIVECSKNHTNSVNEPGNLRFDVLQYYDNSCKFLLYEAYESEEHSAAHKQTKHYAEWKSNVEIMMAKSRYGSKYKVICPTDKDKW